MFKEILRIYFGVYPSFLSPPGALHIRERGIPERINQTSLGAMMARGPWATPSCRCVVVVVVVVSAAWPSGASKTTAYCNTLSKKKTSQFSRRRSAQAIEMINPFGYPPLSDRRYVKGCIWGISGVCPPLSYPLLGNM